MNSPKPSTDVQSLYDRYVIGNYRRLPVSIVRGEGSLVWDAEGNDYLDFFPGWGCNLLGHCPPRVVRAVREQVGRLIHVPNSWLTEGQAEWAKKISDHSFGGQVFFCNSGAEANEAAIKLARLHGDRKRYKIISFDQGFHGRTMGALSATAQSKYHEGVGPMLAGFQYCPFDDLEATARRITDETVAILVEPIQGEGGVRVPSPAFLQGLRRLCDDHQLLLIFDEVQTGCGRTGDWFAYQHFGVEPDMMTLAKGLCGGIAGGAMVAKRDVAEKLRPGTHASTFGGNPIAAAAGIAFFETIESEGLLEKARFAAERFAYHLRELQSQCESVVAVRQVGLMIGIELEFEGQPVVAECLEEGLLINCTQNHVLRLLPALNIPTEFIDAGMSILSSTILRQASERVSTVSGN